MEWHRVEDLIEFSPQTFPFFFAQGHVSGSHQVVVEGSVGVLGRICSLIGERGANITNIDFVDRKPDFYSIVIEIHVKDLKHLSDIMTSIEADTDIATVIRTKEFIETPSNQKIQSLSNY